MKSNESYILWLPSWYPNKLEPYNGDFIQRHAKAASSTNNIHVLFVTEINKSENSLHDTHLHNGLTEEIIYFKNAKGFLKRIKKQILWVRLMLFTIEKILKLKGKPLYIHIHVPWKAGLIALYFKKKYGIPYLLTEHWGIYNKKVSNNYFDMPLYKKILFKKIFKDANLFFSVSHYLAREINQIFKIKRSLVIPNVVDTNSFYLTKEKHSKFTFIHVSNMVDLKNVEGILKAFHLLLLSKQNLNVQLLLIGNTNNKFEIQAKNLGLTNNEVIFKGEISYFEVAAEMRKSHCFVLNSDIENSPCVISEALCCGLPIIATNVGGVKELFNENEGVLIPPNDAKALLFAMNKILDEYEKFDLKQIAMKAGKTFNFNTIGNMFKCAYDSNMIRIERM